MKLPYYPYCAGSSRVLPTLAVSSCFVLAQAAELEFSLLPSSDNFGLGADFVLIADINEDGVDDLAVSDPNYSGDGLFATGIVYRLSGASGEILSELTGNPASQRLFGSSLAALDANGDGITDLAIGASGQSVGAGAVHLISGADDSVLFEIQGSIRSGLGASLAAAGDQNGDGKEDFFVGAPQANSSLGSVDLISGADGSLLWSIGADQGNSSFGVNISVVGDLDGDSKPDLAVAAPNHREGPTPVGRVDLIRSSDQSIAATLTGAAGFDLLGYSLKTVPDVNNDDQPDLMIGSFSGGVCYVVSGVDLAVLVDLSIPDHPPFQPLVAGGGFDDDGDGITDWLLGSPGFTTGETGPLGGFRIVSGSDRSLLLNESASSPFTRLGNSVKTLPGFGFGVSEPSFVDPDTSGRSTVQFWSVAETVLADTDGDGVLDEEDAVIESNMSPTLVILGCDTGIENRVEPDGTTLADRFDAIPSPTELKSRGRYIRKSSRLLRELMRADLITRPEARIIFKTTFRALLRCRNVPKCDR